jgi:tripartite-type tricarboxylate transporter receptor subunit TctC
MGGDSDKREVTVGQTRRRWLNAVGWASVAVAMPMGSAVAQVTDKSLRLVVPYPPGGTIDSIARIVGEKLQHQLPSPVVIENRAGANGNIGADNVYRSAPDGTSLLFAPSGPIAVNQNLYLKLSYDPTRWVPVTMLADVPNVLVTTPTLPVKNLREFIAYVKDNPGKVSYASQGSGSSSHLAAVMFMELTGTDMSHIPYKGTAPALTDLIGGQVQVFFDNLSSSAKFVDGGKVRILAVADTKRSPHLPDVPTFAETDPVALKAMVSSAWYAVVAPPGTPAAVVAAYQKAIAGVLADAEVNSKFVELGVDPKAATPELTGAYIRQETDKWAKVIRDGHVTAN